MVIIIITMHFQINATIVIGHFQYLFPKYRDKISQIPQYLKHQIKRILLFVFPRLCALLEINVNDIIVNLTHLLPKYPGVQIQVPVT